MRALYTGVEEKFIVQCFNYKYLKINRDKLTGSYLGDRPSSLKPYCGVFRQYKVIYDRSPELCCTITYKTPSSEFLVTISPDKRLVLQPDVEVEEINRRPERFLSCFFKRKNLNEDLGALQSLLYNDFFLYYNDYTGSAEFRRRQTYCGDLLHVNYYFNFYKCPGNRPIMVAGNTSFCQQRLQFCPFDINTALANICLRR